MAAFFCDSSAIVKRYVSETGSDAVQLADQQDVEWQNRAHFFAVAAQVMRHILVDHARTRNYAKRGGGSA